MQSKMNYKVFDFNNVIHEKNRLLILTLLLKCEKMSFSELKENLNLTDGNLVSHLKVLEDNKIIEIEKRFVGRKPKTFYKLTKDGKEKFLNYLNDLKNFLIFVGGIYDR
jgi:DNA-binding HxlR family transcriptional regulator